MERYYWTQDDLELLERVSSYREMRDIAFRVLQRIPRPTTQVCGPISTGGAGSIEKNVARLGKAIDHLHKNGHNIFNQLPFEDSMQRVRRIEGGSYSVTLLEEFYLPIFESTFIQTLYFLPDWQSSRGATWEHDQAERLGLQIVYSEIEWN